MVKLSSPLVHDETPETPFWKSRSIMLSIGLAALGLITLTVLQQATPNILYFQINDVSDSAHLFADMHQQLCAASTQKLKPGDRVVWMSFADRSEVSRDVQLASNLALLGQCQQLVKTASSSLGTVPGTSLPRAIDRLQKTIAHQRRQGNQNPVAIVMTLQAAEPGPEQPSLDWKRLNNQVKQITDDRGVLTIIGPTGQLQNDLTDYLTAPRVTVCPIANAKTCLESTIRKARSL